LKFISRDRGRAGGRAREGIIAERFARRACDEITRARARARCQGRNVELTNVFGTIFTRELNARGTIFARKHAGSRRRRWKIARDHASSPSSSPPPPPNPCILPLRRANGEDYSYRVIANGVATLTKSRYVMRDVTPPLVQLTTRVAARARRRRDVIVPGEHEPRIRYERSRDWPRCYCTCYRRPVCSGGS